jgi:hypothetical protein
MTLASCFVDEVAVANENGFNQLLARCSVEGAKVWTSSNPESPYHWFYLNFIKKAKENQYTIYIRKHSLSRFLELVSPHITESMRYKLVLNSVNLGKS